MRAKIVVFLLCCFGGYSAGLSCTIFCYTENGQTYFCNNEDWSNPDTEIRFYPARDGSYAWVYLGFSNNWAQGGVNEKGLCWDWVAGYRADSWKPDKSKKTYSGNLSEKMVQSCSTVDEAIAFISKYNEDSFSYARMMIADSFGNAAILGWKNGQLHITRKSGELQAFGYKGDDVHAYFSAHPADQSISHLAEALNTAHQEGKYPTQYSNIISISHGKMYLFKTADYDTYIEIDYAQMLKEGYSKYKIPDLFKEEITHPASIRKKSF